MSLEAVVEREARTQRSAGARGAYAPPSRNEYSSPTRTASFSYTSRNQSATQSMGAKSYLNPAVFDLSYLVSDAEKAQREHARTYHPDHIQVKPVNTQASSLGAPNTRSRYVAQPEKKEGYADKYARYQPSKKEGVRKSAFSSMESAISNLAKEVSERYQRVSTWAQTQMGAIYR